MQLIQKKDLVIAGVVILAALAGFLILGSRQTGNNTAYIYHGRELVMEIPLERGVHRTFSVPGFPQVVFEQFEDQTICFQSSDCPDKVCVHTGRIGRSGESAACLPNELIMNVRKNEGEKEDIDAVTG